MLGGEFSNERGRKQKERKKKSSSLFPLFFSLSSNIPLFRSRRILSSVASAYGAMILGEGVSEMMIFFESESPESLPLKDFFFFPLTSPSSTTTTTTKTSSSPI